MREGDTPALETAAHERDDRLAQLLSELTEAARKGEKADVEAAAARHPDVGGELRELWAAAQLAEALTRLTPTPHRSASPALPC